VAFPGTALRLQPIREIHRGRGSALAGIAIGGVAGLRGVLAWVGIIGSRIERVSGGEVHGLLRNPRLIASLATDQDAWITGQTINTEGGFRR
jgi:hypothetical protein